MAGQQPVVADVTLNNVGTPDAVAFTVNCRRAYLVEKSANPSLNWNVYPEKQDGVAIPLSPGQPFERECKDAARGREFCAGETFCWAETVGAASGAYVLVQFV